MATILNLRVERRKGFGQNITVEGSGSAPSAWRGNAKTIRVAVFDEAGAVADLTDHSLVKLSYMPVSRTADAIATASASVNDATFTEAQWQAGTHYHAEFAFDETEMNPSLSGSTSLGFWMVCYGILTGTGYETTHGGCTFTVHEDGTANTVTSPDPPETGVTASDVGTLIAGSAVRYDAAQSLTTGQKAQAIANIGAVANPMDGAGQLIYGGASGVPTKLPAASGGLKFLRGFGSTLSWESIIYPVPGSTATISADADLDTAGVSAAAAVLVAADTSANTVAVTMQAGDHAAGTFFWIRKTSDSFAGTLARGSGVALYVNGTDGDLTLEANKTYFVWFRAADVAEVLYGSGGGSAFDPASPGAIGGTTPAAITGTTVTANSGFVAAADQHVTLEGSGALKITGSGSTNHTSFSGIGNWYGNVAVFQSGVGIIAQFGSLGSGVNGLYCAGAIQLASSGVASLGSAAVVGCLKFCTDETGGAIPVFSDGTNWRRVSDRAIAS